jgi:hypothetical protein
MGTAASGVARPGGAVGKDARGRVGAVGGAWLDCAWLDGTWLRAGALAGAWLLSGWPAGTWP